ncbi:hypothetical protein BCV70DRAFT_159133, partial [Testicularia cyperi]
VMAQVKPSLTLDVNVGSSSYVGVGGSGTSLTPRAHQNAVNQKARAQMQASAYAPQADAYANEIDNAYVADSLADPDFGGQLDNGGFSSDDDAQDVYAAATSRLKAGSSSVGAKATRDQAHGNLQSSQQQQQQQQQAQSRSLGSRHQTNGDQDGHDSDSSIEADDYGHESHHRQMADGVHEDEMIYIDDEDGEDIEDDESDLSSSPSIPDENIDFDLVYALHNFVATVEGQATVHKGNSLTLLDDSNSYWWLVRVLRTQEVGYIPAENIETPFERLARLNKHRNVDLTSATDDDHNQVPEKIFTSHLVKARNALGNAGVSVHSGKLSALSRRAQGAPAPLSKEQRRNKRGVAFGPSTYLEHSGDEYSDYDEDGEELDYEEDPDAIYEGEMDEEEAHDDEDEDGRAGPAGFTGMEPDDGMEWDGHEAERIQQQQQQQMQQQTSRAEQQSADRLQSQQQNTAGMKDGYRQSSQARAQSPGQLQPQAESQQQQQQRSSQYNAQNGQAPAQVNGRGPAYAAQQQQQQSQGQDGRGYGPATASQVRSTSAERPVSSVNSNGAHYDAAGRPTSTSMSRNSTASSSGGFLPSQIQRERANSDASANSSAYTGDSLTHVISPDKDKRRSNRSSKSAESLESPDDKSIKKRSGVFSLFSRKDKKDRKSVNLEDRESLVGRSSEDSFAGPNRGRNSPAVVPGPSSSVQAANAGMSPGQSLGMGRAVQERDRAQQEAYQRQFLSNHQQAASGGSHSGDWSQSGDRKRVQRPGSLVGPSGSTPMLSVLRVFAGEGVDSDSTFKTVLLNDTTRSTDLQRQALQRFGVPLHDMDKYVLTIKRLEGDERPLDQDEHPLHLFNTLTDILQEGQVTIPSVKRSSVGSISSISSNLSTHPAIARLGNDFSDDHAVKFYISRRDRLRGYVDLNGTTGDESGRSLNASDVSASQDTSQATSLSLSGQNAARSSHSSVLSADTSDTVQSPTARFALRLLIFASDLPEGIVFDPQSNALIPSAALKGRSAQQQQAPGAEAAAPDRYREKILTFPRNTTVAEVVEEGLDRFGIAEGVVEGGDDVEDRPSRRKSKLHVKYGLAVRAADGERALHPTGKILDAYRVLPTFKMGIPKRRSIDAAALLGASEDVGPNDPIFVLRQITNPHKAKPGTTERALSPTENILLAKQEARQQRQPTTRASPATSPRLGEAKDLNHAGMTRHEIIAAQRAAAAERNAAVLGAQRNAQQGVDVMLSNKARIRSSKLGPSNQFRYSYVPADGQERDISSIIEEVMKEQMLSTDSNYSSSKDSAVASLSPVTAANGRPPFGTKRSMQSDLTTTDDYASARSTPAGTSPLSLDEVNFDTFGSNSTMTNGAARLDGDLLDTLIRGDPQAGDSAIEDRINAVLNRVQSPLAVDKSSESTPKVGSRVSTASPNAPTNNTSGPSAHVSKPTDAGVHARQISIGSELSGSRETASPLTVGTNTTNSAATHATHTTTGTMPTPLSTLVSAGGFGFGSSSIGTGVGGSRSTTPYSTTSLVYGADDQSLSHLYTIVDAAARRDPRKQRLLTHSSMSSISSVTSPTLGGGSGGNTSVSGYGSRPGSKLSTVQMLLEDDKENLKPEPGGLFAPALPFLEDKKVREAYAGISKQLGNIDDSLDALLADVIRIF